MINTSNPYQSALMPKEINYDLEVRNQERHYADEDKLTKAPKILVFPLDQLTQVLSNAFTSLAQVYSLLDQAKRNPIINKKAIEMLQQKIDKINELIISLPQELDNLGI